MMRRFIVFLFAAAIWASISVSASAQQVELSVEVPTDEYKLFGTLMLPSVEQNGKIPIALIIAGSGPTDRNGNNMQMRNNSLKMIAEGLAAAGIASLRYDKRAIGQSSYPKFDQSKATIDLYADDVKRWVEWLEKENRFSSITLIGHSEGALLAMMAANDGAKVDKVISLAGSGRPLDIVIKEQLSTQPEQIKKAAYQIIDTLKSGKCCNDVPIFLNPIFTPSIQPFLISWFQQNPTQLASQLTIPLLIIQGDTDIQIRPFDARSLSAANHSAEMMIIHQMNHVLKHCSSMDKMVQMPYYSNPSLPLHKDLMPNIVHFIQDGHIHY